MRRILIRAQWHIEPARENRGSERKLKGGGFLIHSDLFAQIYFHLASFCHDLLSCVGRPHLQSIVQQKFNNNSCLQPAFDRRRGISSHFSGANVSSTHDATLTRDPRFEGSSPL
jgi:hypothetical protein